MHGKLNLACSLPAFWNISSSKEKNPLPLPIKSHRCRMALGVGASDVPALGLQRQVRHSKWPAQPWLHWLHCHSSSRRDARTTKASLLLTIFLGAVCWWDA